ncbi:MAG: 30S ribosomal protein S24e [Thermoplasmata archaeon]
MVDKMAEVEIEHEEENDLMNRREMTLKVAHEGEGTPTRESLTGEIASLANTSKENIVIDKVDTEYGKEESSVKARIYEDSESMEKYERDYFKDRG